MSDTISRVIVGVGGSPGSLQAMRHAVDLAREHHAELVLVLAWLPPGGEAQARCAPAPDLDRDLLHAAEARLRTALEEGLGALPADVLCLPEVVRGPVAPVLLAVADRIDDVLVVGAGRRGAISRLLHTRIAPYCVAHACCCVVAVPPPPLAGTSSHLKHLAV